MHLATERVLRDRGAEERALLRRVALRERSAFEQLYLDYHRRLSRFLMRFSESYEAAEEIINDTMMIVWDKAADFRGDSQVSTWIIGIAYRRMLKSFKHRDVRRRAETDALEMEAFEAAGEGEGAADADGARADWLARGMRMLPLEQRLTLELAYFLGHSCEEIAQITACPVNTVKTRMFHARQRLRQLLPRLAEPTADTDKPVTR